MNCGGRNNHYRKTTARPRRDYKITFKKHQTKASLQTEGPFQFGAGFWRLIFRRPLRAVLLFPDSCSKPGSGRAAGGIFRPGLLRLKLRTQDLTAGPGSLAALRASTGGTLPGEILGWEDRGLSHGSEWWLNSESKLESTPRAMGFVGTHGPAWILQARGGSRGCQH